jgi:predicted Zn-dependent protease
MAQAQIDAAADIVQGLLIESPDDPEASLLMFQVLTHRKDFVSAVALLDQMGLHQPDRQVDFQFNAADLLYKNGDVDSAIQRLSDLLDKYPLHFQARYRLAQIFDEQGYFHDANEQTRSLIRHSPASLPLLSGMASFPGAMMSKDLLLDAADDESKSTFNGIHALQWPRFKTVDC